jgi:hypothetical protein
MAIGTLHMRGRLINGIVLSINWLLSFVVVIHISSFSSRDRNQENPS